jgi:hypothetical protein
MEETWNYFYFESQQNLHLNIELNIHFMKI